MELKQFVAEVNDFEERIAGLTRQLADAREEIARLRKALEGLLSKFPKEETDYSGVGWCAGCGALHWCSGNPGEPEKCKPHCVLQTAKQVLETKGGKP